jgi:hypothetical protein
MTATGAATLGDLPQSNERIPLRMGAKVYADLCFIVATGRLAGRTALAAIRDALAGPVPARTAA